MNRQNLKNSLLMLPGLFGALFLWLLAAFAMCGISGCSGGGFGVSTDPLLTLILLAFSGVAVSLVPFLIAWRYGSHNWKVIAFALLLLTPIIGGFLIGAGLDGYPR